MNVAIYTDSYFNKDKLFDASDRVANRDNCLEYAILFKQEAEKVGFRVHTADLLPVEEQDVCLYFDLPDHGIDTNKLNYLFIYESEIIKPRNFIKSLHNQFKKIFTWSDELVDNIKYFKMNFLFSKSSIFDTKGKRDKFLTLIAGNKEASNKNELYSERLKSIRWWEKHFPNEFEFYGLGWNTPRFNKPFQKMNRFASLRSLLPRHRCYLGSVENKHETLSQYQFSLCYENATNYPGYITEKIFDCFLAGVIPIYWGPPNVDLYFPRQCYIDRRNFKTNFELRKFLLGLSVGEVIDYQEAIIDFLHSDRVRQFTSPYFSEQIIPHLVQDTKS